jgi:hypothetical protein
VIQVLIQILSVRNLVVAVITVLFQSSVRHHIRKHRQLRFFLLSLRTSCNQKKMLVVARAIPNLELQISYFHRGGIEQIFHVQLVLLYLCMRVTKTNWPEAFRARTAHAIAATDNVIMLQIINDSALAKINSMSTKLKGGLSISKNCKQLARNLHP